MITVKIPTSLKKYAKNKKTIQINAISLKELFDELRSEFGDEIVDSILTSQNELRNFTKIFINGVDVGSSNVLKKSLSDKDIVVIITAVAGG